MKINLLRFALPFLLSLVYINNLSAQTFIEDTEFESVADTINSVSVDYSSTPGILQLETGERENLALNKLAYLVYQATPPTDTLWRLGQRTIDGNKSTFISIPSLNIGGNNNLSYLIIDLQALRTIKRVVLYSFANNVQLRPLAFTVYTGEDTLTMEKVFENFNNDVANPEASFNTTIARYIKVVFNIIAQSSNLTLSEVEVYGEGFLPEGTFFSNVKSLTKRVNFSTFEYGGNVPAGTSAEFSLRSGDTPIVDSSWSNWSEFSSGQASLFSVYEPRQYLQYKLRLRTDNLQTPEIDFIRINYDTVNIASFTGSQISPQYATILKESEFTLSVTANFEDNDHGIDTLKVLTPSPINLISVTVNGSAGSFLSSINANELILAFNSTITANSIIDIKFTTTPFLGISPYSVSVSSKLVANNPQRVDAVLTNNVESWSIITIGVPEKLIISAEAVPNPFTPNSDGVNDVTKFNFFLGNVGEPSSLIGKQVRNLSIKVYDLTGRLVKTVFNNSSSSFAFISSNAIEWDGRDEDGNILRPGVYVYQIIVDSDNGGESEARTIVISY